MRMAFVLDPRPLGDHLLVREIDAQEGRFRSQVVMTPIQIRPFVTENDQQPVMHELPEPDPVLPARGIVTAVGPGYAVSVEDERFKFVPMQVAVGDEILFFSQGGTLLRMPPENPGEEHSGESLILIREAQVLVVLSSVEQTTEDDA